MIESKNDGAQPRKLLAGGAAKFKIALASGIVLVTGAWLTPRSSQSGLSASQEHAAPLLEEQAQLREPSRPFVGVQEVAATAMQYAVAILPPPSPATPSRNDYGEAREAASSVTGCGVIVSGTHVLTHSAALDGRSAAVVMMSDGFTVRADVVTYEPATGLVLLRVESADTRASATLSTASPPPGSLAVAVGRSNGRELAVPVFVTSAGADEYTVSASGGAVLPGMPIFTLGGELFALTAPDGGRTRALSVRQAAERLLARASSGDRRSSFGLGYQMPQGGVADLFGREGALITAVLPGSPADAADLRVGDVLLAVGGVPIDSAETVARLLSTAPIGAPTALRVRRGTRVSELDATPAAAYEIAALARSSVDAAPALEARALFPAAVLEASSIPLTARVISVNGRTVTTRAQVQRELRLARQPIPVLLRAGANHFFASVAPSR